MFIRRCNILHLLYKDKLYKVWDTLLEYFHLSADSQFTVYTFRAFIRPFSPKWFTVIHTFMHWWWWLPCKVLTSTSGAVWGSVSCPRTLLHADQENRTSSLQIKRRWLYPWATAALYSCKFDYNLLLLIFLVVKFMVILPNNHHYLHRGVGL